MRRTGGQTGSSREGRRKKGLGLGCPHRTRTQNERSDAYHSEGRRVDRCGRCGDQVKKTAVVPKLCGASRKRDRQEEREGGKGGGGRGGEDGLYSRTLTSLPFAEQGAGQFASNGVVSHLVVEKRDLEEDFKVGTTFVVSLSAETGGFFLCVVFETCFFRSSLHSFWSVPLSPSRSF